MILNFNAGGGENVFKIFALKQFTRWGQSGDVKGIYFGDYSQAVVFFYTDVVRKLITAIENI
jgi:hypothetical protein